MKVELTPAAQRDLADIAEHLFQSYLNFGQDPAEATQRATDRAVQIRETGIALGNAPHRGTRHDAMLPGLRNVTIDRAIYWFVADEPTETVRILAIFFGGQDHIRHMLVRLLAADRQSRL